MGPTAAAWVFEGPRYIIFGLASQSQETIKLRDLGNIPGYTDIIERAKKVEQRWMTGSMGCI